MLVLLALIHPAEAVDLELFGSCPGAHAITIDGLSPGAAVAVLSGRGGDGDVIRTGPCMGTVVGVEDVRMLARLVDDDFDGTIYLERVLAPKHCGLPLQVVDLTTCDLTDVALIGIDVEPPVDCPTGWALDTPCNGVDFGGGCTIEETGYHYEGVFENAGQDYACWWHTKNQAWNTDTSTNFFALAAAFGLETGIGGSRWCHPLASDPCGAGACVREAGGYFDPGNVGAWGWCGDGPFESGGHVCIPIPDDLAADCD